MKKIVIIGMFVILQGCALHSYVPSFWDDNQSKKIIDVRQRVENINCAKPHAPQAQAIHNDLQWFELYSESKGMIQNDVRALIKPLQETTDDFLKRSSDKEGSRAYCEGKKKVMQTQAYKAAQGVLDRW
jgi:hypothetical protein